MKTLLEIFIFFTLPLEIADKTKLSPWIFHKIVLDPMEIPHYSFLVTPGNSTLFLINHWKFHMLSLYTLGYPPPPPVWIFPGIAQYMLYFSSWANVY